MDVTARRMVSEWEAAGEHNSSGVERTRLVLSDQLIRWHTTLAAAALTSVVVHIAPVRCVLLSMLSPAGSCDHKGEGSVSSGVMSAGRERRFNNATSGRRAAGICSQYAASPCDLCEACRRRRD